MWYSRSVILNCAFDCWWCWANWNGRRSRNVDVNVDDTVAATFDILEDKEAAVEIRRNERTVDSVVAYSIKSLRGFVASANAKFVIEWSAIKIGAENL
jgi:hypothetical protein